MSTDEAKQILLFDTLDNDGLYIRLRLGSVSTTDEILHLRYALRVLWRSIAPLDHIPSDIAFSCAIILHYADECFRNMRRQQDAITPDLELAVRDMIQGAFDVLAGDNARSWLVPRADLGDVEVIK